MRYIIKKIIIGVGIAIAMMMITKTFSLKTYAATTFNVVPIELRLSYKNTSNNTSTTTYTTLNELTDVRFPYNTFYGRSNFNQNYFMYQQLYRFETSSSAKSGYYDINFLFFQEYALGGDTPQVASSFNIRNNSRIFTCTSDDSGPLIYQNGQANWDTGNFNNRNIIGVKCSNVYLDLENNNVVYAMIESTSLKAWTNTAYGVSAMTFQVNSSSSIQNSIEQNTQAQQETTDAVNDVNDTLNDDDTTDAQNSGSSFFNNFSNTDHGGLSGVITAPLRFINNLLGTGTMSGRCTSISLPLPFVNKSATLPCASTILFNMQGGSTLYTIISTITTGIIAYWVIVKIFAHVRSFKKPDEDKVEVLDL